ncbi:MAG: cyclic lactone autoinducer peptide [Desulfotomaculum sp.]|nr:cyclic lactone autoinducer peptide [Desulfotomaculum sp.]
MFSKIKMALLTSLCTIAAAAAVFNVGINCVGMLYEPEFPESLKK